LKGEDSLKLPLLRDVVFRAIRLLEEAGPREIKATVHLPPVLLFTDGAVEGDLVTHGAVLIDPISGARECFGDKVPCRWVQRWGRGGKKQVIGQAELFPLLVAKATWAVALRGRRVMWFCDNESARLAVVRGFSAVGSSAELLMVNAHFDVSMFLSVWCFRVPSKSNISDDASRLDLSSYVGKHYRVISPNYAGVDSVCRKVGLV
jgi:hypothetical protein